jgi:hypothetical protein
VELEAIELLVLPRGPTHCRVSLRARTALMATNVHRIPESLSYAPWDRCPPQINLPVSSAPLAKPVLIL